MFVVRESMVRDSWRTSTLLASAGGSCAAGISLGPGVELEVGEKRVMGSFPTNRQASKAGVMRRFGSYGAEQLTLEGTQWGVGVVIGTTSHCYLNRFYLRTGRGENLKFSVRPLFGRL